MPAEGQPSSLPRCACAAPLPSGALRAAYDPRLGGPRPVLLVKPQDGPAAHTKEQIMATQRKTPSSKPTHRVYLVTGTGKSAFWTPIGAAWPNRDGAGYSITCDAIPIQSRIVMRKISERPASPAS